MNEKLRRSIPLIVFSVILLLLLVISSRYITVGPSDIQAWINSFGIWAPLFFILIYTVRPVILFPASVLSIAGGLAFGAFQGFFYIQIGATLSAVTAFLISRQFHDTFVKKEQAGRMSKIKGLMEERGFFYVLVLRLIPLLNFDLISYSAGLANVRLRAFVLATLIGIVPGTLAFSFLGSSFAAGDSQVLLISIGVFVVLLTIPLFFRKKVASLLGLEKNDSL